MGECPLAWPAATPPGPSVVSQDAVGVRLARELHDGAAQTLATLLIDLENFRAEQRGRQSVLDEIQLVQDGIREALFDIRQLLYDLRGMPGVEQDLAGSLRRGFVRRFSQRTGIRVRLSVARSWPSQLPAQTALNLYRVIQEGLNNVGRHSGASKVSIRFEASTSGSWATLRIADNGRGFPLDGNEPWHGMGLLGMRERALLLGAQLTFANRGGGKGGTVIMLLDKARLTR